MAEVVERLAQVKPTLASLSQAISFANIGEDSPLLVQRGNQLHTLVRNLEECKGYALNFLYLNYHIVFL
jgi:hypothetical protein